MIEDDQKDGCTAEKDREGVKLGVGDHCCAFGVLFASESGCLRMHVNKWLVVVYERL